MALKEVPPTVVVPPMRQGPCYDSVGEGLHQVRQLKPQSSDQLAHQKNRLLQQDEWRHCSKCAASWLVLCELVKRASKDGVFLNAVPHNAVKVTNASTDGFVLGWVWRGHDRPGRVGKASLFNHHILLRAGIRDVVNDK